MAAAWASGGYTPREIGDYSGMHYSRISRIGQPDCSGGGAGAGQGKKRDLNLTLKPFLRSA